MKSQKLLLLAASVVMLAGCNSASGGTSTPASSSETSSSSSSKKDFEDEDLFSFVETSNGKKLVVKNYYESSLGAFGVLVGHDDVDDISEIFSSNYSSVTEKDGVYTCEASVTSDNGSKFSTVDTIYAEDGHVKINRTFKVDQANSTDLGFSVYFRMESVEEKKVLDYEWFCPSAYYGNDDWTFTGSGVKSAFTTDNAVVMNDNSGTALLMNYVDNTAFALMDTSDGFRETIASDYGVHDCHILIDERLNCGGVGIREVDNHTQLFQNYPSYSYNFMGIFNFMTQYRMLPVTKGLERTISFDINCKKYDSFYAATKENWRYSYEYYAVVDKRYSAADIYQASLEYLDRSFGYKSNIPQYMLNSDHPWPDSGFLYRNSDLAYLMLAAGRKQGRQDWIDDALEVMENQIKNDRLDKGLIASQDTLYRNRSTADALYNLCLNYQSELKFGVKHSDWLTYLKNKASVKLSSTKWFDAMFLSEFAKMTNTKSYASKAAELMLNIQDEHLKYHYTDVISNPNAEYLCEKEGAIIAMITNMNLYEFTKEEHFLEQAERDALAVESFQMIQPVCLDSYDNPGYGKDEIADQEFNQGCVGNKRFLPYGLNFVCTQTCSADNASVLCAPDFYRLYKATGDQHYYDFYEYLTYNSTLYVNMGDKVGHMDDILHSSGKGFQNEYFGISVTEDPASYRRGSIHDSNLAWNMYAVVANYERMSSILEDDTKIVACDDVNRDFDLKKNKYCTKTEAGYVVDLYELCNVSKIEGFSEEVEFSVDGETYTKGTTSTCANYVRIPLTADIKNVKVMGLPITYSTLNYASETTVNVKTFASAQDWNYKTTASIDRGVDIIINLGSKHVVSEVALKAESITAASFDVYVSADGTNYTDYGSFKDANYFIHVLEKNVSDVQYVKLVNRSTKGGLTIKEFKVLGY